MYSYRISEAAFDDLKHLSPDQVQKIVNKIKYYTSSGAPLSFAKRLTHTKIGQYRFRMGNYRVVFDLEGEVLKILRIGHRREIYK